MTTLDTMRPNWTTQRPWHVTAEYNGRRYLITHAPDIGSAEYVALDYVGTFTNASFFTGDVYGSQAIDGNARDFRAAYQGVRT